MAHSFEIRNIDKRLDGDYPMPKRSELTALEWSWIKRFADYNPMTLDDGLDGFDPPLVVCLALISMVREGRVKRGDVLAAWDTLSTVPFDHADDAKPTVRFVVDPDVKAAAEAEGGADPTPEPTTQS